MQTNVINVSLQGELPPVPLGLSPPVGMVKNAQAQLTIVGLNNGVLWRVLNLTGF